MKNPRFTFVLFVAFILLALTSCSGGGGGDSSSTTPFEGTWAKTEGTAGTASYGKATYTFSGTNVNVAVTTCTEISPGNLITMSVTQPATFTYDETAKTLTITISGAATGSVTPADNVLAKAHLADMINDSKTNIGKSETGPYNFPSATVLELGGVAFTKE